MRGEGASKDSTVQVSTDLPPQVDGQLRCFCKLSVPKISWVIPKSPAVTYVRVKWWGEDGQGTIFRPLDLRKGKHPETRTVARYPVRSGPMQFATYLKDMSSLILDVIDSPNSRPIGQSTVSGLSQLSTSKGIQKKLPVLSPTGQKIADLDVSLVLEHLMASYDCNGSVPTSDLNTNKPKGKERLHPSGNYGINNAQFPVNGYSSDNRLMDHPQGNNHTVAITANGDVVSMPVNGSQQAISDPKIGRGIGSPQSRNTGGGGDLLSMLVDKGKMLRDAMAVSAMHTDQDGKYSQGPDEVAWNPSVGNSPGPLDLSLLANSTVPSPQRAINMLMGSSPIKKQDLQLYKFVTDGSPGTSLSSDFGLDHMMSEFEDPHYEQSILKDLFYNDSDIDAAQIGIEGIPFQNFLQPYPAISSSFPIIPSAEDLPTIFSSKVPVDDPGNQRPPSRASSVASLNLEELQDGKDGAGKNKKIKRKARSRSRSRSNSTTTSRSRSRSATPSRPSEHKTKKDEGKENLSIASKNRSAINLHKPKKKLKSRSRARERLLGGKKKSSVDCSTDMSTIGSDASFVSESLSQKSDVDGLSVERLTLLGRVQVARVNVEILNLKKSNVWDLSSIMSDTLRNVKSKRPTRLKKPCAFFVEYQFPIVASSKDKYTPNAFATEVTRVASKNMKNGAVSFGHRSVNPILFDGSSLERWWNSALVFRLYAREAGQNSPSLVGSGGISLKSILKSDNLFVKREVEIPDSNHDGLLNSSRSSMNTTLNSRSGITIFGHLKISIELSSDHKEFATVLARTKLSEMSANVKMVPMGGIRREKAQLVKQLDKNKDIHIAKPAMKKMDIPFVQQETALQNNNNANIMGLPPQSPRRKCNGAASNSTEVSVEDGCDEIGMLKKQLKGLIGNLTASTQSGSNNSMETSTPLESPTLQCLLYIEEGHNMSINGIPPLHMANRQTALLHRQACGNKTLTRSPYLACRMFWCDDTIHSQVCWNTLNPQFDFLQVSPVTLNSSLLEKMKDNYMIVEVWDKQTMTTSDKLIGLVKLSLHQFYLSFRDRKIGNALLKSEYPVMAVDNYMPIIDLFSGLYFGQLKVVLAMGSSQQISQLQQAVVSGMQCRVENFHTQGQHRGQESGDAMTMLPARGLVDHHFEIVVEGVRGLKVFEKMIWGEADCFVQFFFPSQGEARENVDMKSLTRMKCCRTATTLCIPDPVFHDTTQIKLTLPEGKPVQPELLIACSSPGEKAKGLPFEVWCRYYHPNVRDQRIAQGILPIAKLCAMVTMHRPSQSCVQSFSIHLSQVPTNEGHQERNNTGILDVGIRYCSQTAQREANSSSTSRNHLNSQVTLTVEVIRAAGLKAASEFVAQSDSSMAFCADVGVNPYIRVRLPFTGKESEKMTQTIARCFTPEFSQCMDFSCALSMNNNASSSRTTSLAEWLEGADAVFEVWHQMAGQSFSDARIEEETYLNGPIRSSGDVLLGTCNVPLVSLLTHTAGIHGWFPITQPQLAWTKVSENDQTSPKNQVLGGLELSLRFGDLNDRDTVVDVGHGLGWSPLHLDPRTNRAEGRKPVSLRIAIKVELASFPKASAARPGHSDVEASSLCYVCYKLFDQGVIVSKSRRIHHCESGALQSHISDKNEFLLPYCPDLQRYLQEKRLEIQVWVTHSDGKKGEPRPRQGDKLIGSSYVDLDSLLDVRKKEQQISGSFPMFNATSPSLKSAFIRANIVSSLQHSSTENQISDIDGSMMDTDQCSDTDSTLTLTPGGDIHVSKSHKKKRGKKSGDIAASFSVVLALERAMHLPMVSERNRSSEVRPTTYVSYQSAEKTSPSHTSIFPNSCSPLWDYAVETRLSNEYLHKQNKNLVLKVWHKPSDASKSPDKSSDRVLGFVSVDLSPIAKGLNQLCGWYNIIDFTGQCRGQIKVSITPQDLQTTEGTFDVNTSCIGVSSMPTPILSLSNTQTVASTVAQQLLQLQQHVISRMGSLSRNLTADDTTSTNNNHNFDSSEDLLTTDSSNPTPRLSQHRPFSNNRLLSQPDTPREESSKSFLFSTLRRQLADLDKVMEGFKERTVVHRTTQDHVDAPILRDGDNERSGEVIYGSQSELSTIHTASSLMNTRESSAPSRINNNSSTDVITSQELQHNNIQSNINEMKDAKFGSKESNHKLLDSGVFSAKNCLEDMKSGEEGVESGRTDKNMMHTMSDNQSTLQSVFDGNEFTPDVVLEDAVSIPLDSDKTQPFILNASHSESSSQNSQGFGLHRSHNRVCAQGSPTKSDSTAHSSGFAKRNDYTIHEGSRSTDPKTHLEILEGEVSDDESDEDEEKKFGSYHRYRDLLDAEEDDDEEDDDGNDTVEIVPRNLNLSPVLPETVSPKVLDSVINSARGYDLNENIASDGDESVSKDNGEPSSIDASPSRNVHEGTSVWYSEASEEEGRVGNDRFEEVFEHNQRLLREASNGQNGDDEEEDDLGEWMMMEREVLANQNVEEWLVHRSREDDDEWMKYTRGCVKDDGEIVGITQGRVMDQRHENESQGSEDGRALERISQQTKVEDERKNEMKLFLDEVSDQRYAVRDRNDSSDEDTIREEIEVEDENDDEEKHLQNSFNMNDFLNADVEKNSEVINCFQNLRIDSEVVDNVLDNGNQLVSRTHPADQVESQSLEDKDIDLNNYFTTSFVANGQTDMVRDQSSRGARPKIRHLLSNVELNSETSNSGSRRNSKGSAVSNASQSGSNLHYIENESGPPNVAEAVMTTTIADLHYMNGLPGEDAGSNSDFDIDLVNKNYSNSTSSGKDISQDLINNSVKEIEEEKANSEKQKKRVMSDRNSTMDSAFVDGECSDGHTTTVNSSAVTGGHMSYAEDSCIDPSVDQSQGQSILSNGYGNIGIPNFFMNTEEMQGSISALKMATAAANCVTQRDVRNQNKVKAVSELVNKIADSKMRSKPVLAKTKPPPNTDHTKRIAKIFSSKPR